MAAAVAAAVAAAEAAVAAPLPGVGIADCTKLPVLSYASVLLTFCNLQDKLFSTGSRTEYTALCSLFSPRNINNK